MADKPALEFGLLGELKVEVGGRPVDLEGSRVKTLLAILLTHPNIVVSTDRLVDELWRGEPTPGATATLQGYMSDLRKGLAGAVGGPAPISTRRPGYVLRVDVDHLDFLRFERLVATARAARRDQSELVLRLLREALGLWRGPALTGFVAESFARPVAARLEEARQWVIEERIEIELAQGRHFELVPELRELTGASLLHERLWAQWMLALYRCGRQAEALRAYQELRRRLLDELAIEPSPALKRLEHAVLEQDPALELHPLSGRSAPVSRPDDTPCRLPAQLTKFVGRTSELREARRLLAGTRLLTLTGTGGAGKSRLAVQLATEEAAHISGGVWFVDLAILNDPSSVAGAMAESLGLQKHGSDTASVCGRVGTDQALVILDNCEHLIDASADLVEAVLVACPEVKFLATSREPLGVAGETVWRVPSLSLPPPGPSESRALCASEAVQLFLERASHALPQLAPHDDGLEAVGSICRRLDGMPLAIELAAALVPLLSLAELDERLEHRLDLLSREGRRGVARHRTLRSTIDWSYDLLDPAERMLYARLAVFVGEYTLEAAEAVALDQPGFLRDMSALIRKSMVVAVAGPGGTERYRLLDSLRQYGLERLHEAGPATEADARRRHAAYYTIFAEAADRQLHGGDPGNWSARIIRELPNIRVALEWSFSGGDLELGVRLAGALRSWFFGRMGQLAQARKWIEQALERRHQLAPWLQLKVLTAAMSLSYTEGDHSRSARIGEEAVSLAEELGDRSELAHALMARGGAAVYEGDLARAVDCLKRSLGYCRDLGDRWGAACVLTFWGVASRRSGDLVAARTQLAEGLSIFRLLHDEHNQVVPLIQLALLAQQQGDLEEAKRFSDEAVGLAKRLGDRQLAHTAVCVAGRVELARGDLDAARELLVTSLRSYREVEHQLIVAIAVEGLAIIAHQEDRDRDAARLWGFADQLRVVAVMPLSDERRAEREHYLCRARAAVGDAAIESARCEGMEMSRHDLEHRLS